MLEQDRDDDSRINTDSLCLKFKEKTILNNVTLSFPKNSVTALIGPSGSGKSTFIKCINRMNDYNHDLHVSGIVHLDGQDIYHKNYDILLLRARVGMVFQKPNPFMQSIYKNVVYGPKIHGIRDKRRLHAIAIDSLKKAGLYDEVKDRIHDNAYTLSGGQQQRLCIARALAINPELLLMDEPCSALDPVSASKIDSLIMELKHNYTIILVTHSVRQAQRIADYVAFFEKGQVIEHQNTKDFFSNPKDKRTESYIKSGLH